jgi:hypothetical protein
VLSSIGPWKNNRRPSVPPSQLYLGQCEAELRLSHRVTASYAKKTNDVGDAFAGAARSTVGVEADDCSPVAAEVSAAAAVLVAALVSADAAELEAADVDAAGDSDAAEVSAGDVALPPAGASAAGGATGGGGPPAASSGGAGVKAAWSRAILPAVPPTTSVPSVDLSVA